MNSQIVLSLDSKVYKNPKLINLDSEIFKFEWLKVFTSAEKFRNYINENTNIKEVWVCSSDDIEAINLAAAIKKDRADVIVCLVSYDFTGSLYSRANAAGIDSVINIESLRERLLAQRQVFSSKNKNETNEFKLKDIPQVANQIKNRRKAFVVSILSASGGAGKSSVSAITALLCNMAGLKTLLIDADLQFGDISSFFCSNKIAKIDELINNRGAILNLSESGKCPAILAAPEYPELSEKVIEEFPAILESLKEVYDVIVINTGSFWNELQAMLLERDSKSIFLIDQRPSSISATKKAMGLCNRCGIPTNSAMYAINKCSKRALFSSVDISCALQVDQVAEIMEGGLEVDENLSAGTPIELLQSRNPFAVSIWAMLESILPKDLLDNRKISLKKNKQERLAVKKSKRSKANKFIASRRA